MAVEEVIGPVVPCREPGGSPGGTVPVALYQRADDNDFIIDLVLQQRPSSAARHERSERHVG